MLPTYCEYFGLTREPFNVTPDPSFFYVSASHKEALERLVYGIKARRGFVLLTGEVGTGKTTVIHCLLQELNDGHAHSAFIFNLIGSPTDLLRSVCQEFALIHPAENQKEIHDYLTLLSRFLLESYRNGDNVALIIDEAQNLSAEVLESVRLLSNFETAQDKLLQILLVGQPELGARLNTPELRQLKQRVVLRHHLSPLSLAECKEYIAKRLEIVGGKSSLFTDLAIEAVHTYSTGIPRLINILCDNGLLAAYTLRKKSVEVAMIGEIAQNLQLSGVPWVWSGKLNPMLSNLARKSPIAVGEPVYTKPKETSPEQPKESKFHSMDADVERQAKANIKHFFAKVGPDSQSPKSDEPKSTDKPFHFPQKSDSQMSTAAQSGSNTVGEPVVTKPKETSPRRPKKSKPDSVDQVDVEREAKSNAKPPFAQAEPRSEPATGNGPKSTDKPFHYLPESDASTAAESGSGNVPSRFFDRMIYALTEAIGPMASLIVPDQVAAMGESIEAFPKQRLGQLVDETSREISAEALKSRFQRLMRAEIHAINGGQDKK